MKMTILLYITCLGLCGAGCALTDGPSFNQQANPDMAKKEFDGSQGADFGISTKSLDEKADSYEIDAKFPEISKLRDDETRKLFNDTVSLDTASSVKNFINRIEGPEAEGCKSTFRCFYEQDYETFAHGKYLSVVMRIGEYTGGAHPAEVFRTYVFDTASGKFIGLENLFLAETEFLGALSDLSIEDLSNHLAEYPGWNRGGASPAPEYFKYFWLADDGLHILFPPYQITPHADGEQDVAIPYAKIMRILTPGVAEGI